MVVENLYYLFISGIILGSGPCFSLCAPILISYTAIHKPGIKQSLIAYLTFSGFKLISYMILGLICGIASEIINSQTLIEYSRYVKIILGIFIILIGLFSILKEKSWASKNCSCMGTAGFLTGFTPCLPLIGILNYIAIISNKAPEALLYALIFGLGTILSPLAILVIISGKISQHLSKNKTLMLTIRIIAGIIITGMGIKIILF